MDSMTYPSVEFWAGKKVLVTGFNGFKGSWLTFWLKEMGANVMGITNDSLENTFISNVARESIPNYFNLDIASDSLSPAISSFNPTIVFHLAAQPLVYVGIQDPVRTYETNVGGSLNLLSSINHSSSVQTCIFVTTDKVYGPTELGDSRVESDELRGLDPYSSSKVLSEKILAATHLRSDLKIASVRSGNVVGGGDVSKTRLVPEIYQSFANREILRIRDMNGVRPWLHVLDTLRGYILLAENLEKSGEQKISMNFAPALTDHVSVKKIIGLADLYFNLGNVEELSESGFKESPKLVLNAEKANKLLGWRPKWDWEESFSHTFKWYKDFNSSNDAYELMKRDLARYLSFSSK